jgi:hypothetical protein
VEVLIFSHAHYLGQEKSHRDLKRHAYPDMSINTLSQIINAANPTSRSPFRRGFLLTALALACLALSSAAWAQSSATESMAPAYCSPATLKGAYMGRSSGTLIGLPYTTLNRIVFDGIGSANGSGTSVLNGVVSFPVITATYTVNSDCTGTLTSVPAGLDQNFVVKNDGSQVFFVLTAHPAGVATVSGEAIRLSDR